MSSSKAPEPTEVETKQASLVVFGEVLYDCFPDGHRVLGGAPFNVAWGLKGFGRDPLFISAVGDDVPGRSIRQKMREWGLSEAGLQTVPELGTGEVRVTIHHDEPAYDISMPRAWDAVADAGYAASGLIYHGLLALRNETTRNSFHSLMARSSAKRFFDINLRPPHYTTARLQAEVRGADWLKLNIDELCELLGEGDIEFERAEAFVERLRNQYSVDNVLLTGGASGAMIRGSYGNALQTPAPKPDSFVDTVGAGDSFSAVAIHGILAGWPADEIVRRAGRFASKVCGLAGATTSENAFYNLKNYV